MYGFAVMMVISTQTTSRNIDKIYSPVENLTFHLCYVVYPIAKMKGQIFNRTNNLINIPTGRLC